MVADRLALTFAHTVVGVPTLYTDVNVITATEPAVPGQQRLLTTDAADVEIVQSGAVRLEGIDVLDGSFTLTAGGDIDADHVTILHNYRHTLPDGSEEFPQINFDVLRAATWPSVTCVRACPRTSRPSVRWAA